MNIKAVPFVSLSPEMLCIGNRFLLTKNIVMLNIQIKISRITPQKDIIYLPNYQRGKTLKEEKLINPKTSKKGGKSF